MKELQAQHEQDIEKHLEFEQTLVQEKSDLAMKCELLVVELKNLQTQMAKEASDFERQLKDAKERWAASEKVRREQWMLKKTDEIKKSTIKALEPDVQAIMAKCRENIQKAQEAANEEKRKLIIQHEKDKEEWIIKEREATDKKLVEAREKERSKLMYRLDAADAELQQQLNTQRRRLQDEAEKARNDVVLEIRQLKQTHAKELEEMRIVERQRIEYELQQLQKDKEELGKRYETDVALLREKYQSDLELAQTTINTTLRSEFDMEKKRLEQEMIRRRDEKIEMIIEKFQLETQRKVEAAEKLLAVQYEERAKEFEKKLRAASDMEIAWMEKNRDLYDKCTKLEADREQLKAHFSEQAYGLQQAHSQCAQLQQTIQQERSKYSREEEIQKSQWEKLKVDLENEQKLLKSTINDLQSKFEAVESINARQLQELHANHDEILEKLHTRVRATIAKKDEMIDSLREQLHFSQIRLNKYLIQVMSKVEPQLHVRWMYFALGFLSATIAFTFVHYKHQSPIVLVTGGLGFIGSHVVDELITSGYSVVIMDNLSNGKNFEQLVSNDAIEQLLLNDITHFKDFKAIQAPIDYIVHLAAATSVPESVQEPEKYYNINVRGTQNVLQWAKKHQVKKIIAASTSAVYGNIHREYLPVNEVNATGGISPYALSKYEMEALLEAYAQDGLPAIALRMFNVYGPRQDPQSPYCGVVNSFMHLAAQGKPLNISGDGSQYRDFIYVKDVARAVRIAMESPLNGFHAINICTGVKTTISTLASHIIQAFGSVSAIENLPPRRADIKESVCNPSKATILMGFTANYTLQDGIAATYEWFLN
ncbi:UDP-glucose 4-epimerase [Thraustotheca clavata]|uniref:UDP-glucose 4-epimerase n=1 Tax=Thraustotheca clavata TaxID=74557 RepID=A0A1V9ZUX1_9STRA|nr:UDP-glucose 4-epimerase [Thraustotheca clavata]